MELDDEIAMMERQVDEMREKEQAAGGESKWTSAEDVQQALDAQKNNHKFAKDTDDRSVFITNLPKGEDGYITTHEDLCKFFEDCGRIATCTILRDRKTQELKGSAYLEFATYEGHGKAMDTKQNAIFHGRPIKVAKKRSLYRPTGARGGRGAGAPRGGNPMGGMGGMMGGMDPMEMFASMIAAATGANMMGGRSGGRGGGRGGARGGGASRGGSRGGAGGSFRGGGAGGATNAFGNAANAFGGGNTNAFGGNTGGGTAFGGTTGAGAFGGGGFGGGGGAFGGGAGGNYNADAEYGAFN